MINIQNQCETYSIWVGEVSSIGQPAAEVVVRASPAQTQGQRSLWKLVSQTLSTIKLHTSLFASHTLVHRKHPVPSDVVDHERSCSSAVVRAGDSPETLLTRRVPDLQFDLLAAHLDYPRTELHTDRMGTVCHDWRGERRLQLLISPHCILGIWQNGFKGCLISGYGRKSAAEIS